MPKRAFVTFTAKFPRTYMDAYCFTGEIRVGTGKVTLRDSRTVSALDAIPLSHAALFAHELGHLAIADPPVVVVKREYLAWQWAMRRYGTDPVMQEAILETAQVCLRTYDKKAASLFVRELTLDARELDHPHTKIACKR